MQEPSSLGARLVLARQQAGLSQLELVARIQQESGAPVRQQQISQLEQGRVTNSKYLPVIADALHVNLEWLLSGIGPMRNASAGWSPERKELVRTAESIPEDVIKEAVSFLRFLRQAEHDKTR